MGTAIDWSIWRSIEMNELNRNYESVQQFERLYRKAFFKKITGVLKNHHNRLIPFSEIKEILGTAGEHHAGNQTVAISQIVGSENRYDDFDRAFLPLNKRTRSKWVNVNQFRLRSQGLPLISLYQVGPYFFIRDGHHRVSAARHAGQQFIDAEVTELVLPRDRSANSFSSPEEFFLQLEETLFRQKTGLDDITVTIPGGYLEILRLIKCFQCSDCPNTREINRDCPGGIPWNQAVREWKKTCYLPAVSVINESKIIARFKQRTPTDLYLWTLHNAEVLRKAACFLPSSQNLSLGKKRPDSFFFSPPQMNLKT